MAALARQTDAKAIGGLNQRAVKQNPKRKLRTVRKNLTEHVYESQFEWTEDERVLIGSFFTDLAKEKNGFTGLQPAPLKQITKPKHKPSAKAKPIKQDIRKYIPVIETPEPVIQSSKQTINNVSVAGFIGLIESDNVRQAKSYIEYAADDYDNSFERSSIRSCQQDWIRPYVDQLSAICAELEPMQEAPMVERDQDDLPVFVHLSQTIETVTVKGKSRRSSKQKIRVEVQRTKQYDAWLEQHTPIVNRKGEPLCCQLIGVDTPTVRMTVSTPTPVMLGDIQVGMQYRSEVVKVPLNVSDSVATAYKWSNIDSKISKWGTSYVDPSDKLCDQVVSNFVHRWNKAPTLPAFGKGSTTDLPRIETERFVSSETTFFHEIERIRSEQFKKYQRLIHGHDTVHIRLANLPRKLAEAKVQDDSSVLYNSVDVSGVPWDSNEDDTVEVINHSNGAAIETTSSDGYVIAGLAEYLSSLPIWDRVEAKLKLQDRKEFLYKYAIAQDMERARKSANEIARLDAWLHSREADTAVMSDHVRYNEWCDEQIRLDPYGAVQVHLMAMEQARPSFTLDSGENCTRCKKHYYKRLLTGLHQTSYASFIGPKMTGEAVVTPPVVLGKARGSSPLTSLTNPIPGCKTRLILPDTESEESILRKLTLTPDEIPEKFLRLTTELKKDVVNMNIVRELKLYFVKSDTGLLVPC